MLDLDFEDGREILEISDDKVALKLTGKIKQLLKECKKEK
jgi:hypothetical protein